MSRDSSVRLTAEIRQETSQIQHVASFVSSADWQQSVQLYLLLTTVSTAGLGQQRQTHPTVGPAH